MDSSITTPTKTELTGVCSISSEHLEVILRALAQSTEPLTVKRLRDRLTGPFRLAEEQLTSLLDAEVSTRRVYRFISNGKVAQLRYWTRSPEELARETLLRFLSQRPHTRSELFSRAKTTLAGFSQERQRQMLAELIRAEKVHELPGHIGSRSKLYSTLPAAPGNYLEYAIKKICEKLKLGREEVLDVAREIAGPIVASIVSPSEMDESQVARIVQMKLVAAQGGLVPLNQLWHSLEQEGCDKTSFDRAVLNMAASYRVALQRHNFPASLSEEERAELVADELGNFFVGIALR